MTKKTEPQSSIFSLQNAGNQQQNQAGAGNTLNPALLPIGYVGNPAWPQALAAYTEDGSGVYPGPGITLADGRAYTLLQQVGGVFLHGRFLLCIIFVA